MSERSDVFKADITGLVGRFKAALAGTGWSTREQPRKLRDEMGEFFTAPSLYVWQVPTTLVLDPTGYDIPGADGVADLYLLPDYVPVATLYLETGVWRIHSPYPTATTPGASSKAWGRVEVSEGAILEVVEAISQDAALSG